MKIWYTVGDPFGPRSELDLGHTPYNIANKREAAEVCETCAADYFHKHKFMAESHRWPARVTIFTDSTGRPVMSVNVDVEMLPSFTAYTHTDTIRG